MHELEPYYRWRDDYIAAEDLRSPFYKTVYSEFTTTSRFTITSSTHNGIFLAPKPSI